jgi:hypothetical protein
LLALEPLDLEPLDLAAPDLEPPDLEPPWPRSCSRRLRTSFSTSSSTSAVVFWSQSLKLSS